MAKMYWALEQPVPPQENLIKHHLKKKKNLKKEEEEEFLIYVALTTSSLERYGICMNKYYVKKNKNLDCIPPTPQIYKDQNFEAH